MGDDNEIRQLIRRESETSLKTALDKSKDVARKYDFETEFAKTKRNRSFVVVGVTAAAVLAVGIAAFLVTTGIERKTESTPVDVAAFDDLNLKEILDSSKRNEMDIERIQLEQNQLAYDLKAATDAADRKYQAAVESVKARSLGAAEEKAGIAAAAAVAASEKKGAKAVYASGFAGKSKELAAVRKKSEQYDSRLVEQAQQQKAILANERIAFDLEKKKQADFYESRIAELESARAREVAELKRQKAELAASLTSRYNPTFADERSQALLAASAPAGASAPAAPFHPYLASSGLIDGNAESRLDTSLSDLLYLSAKLRSVPYLNSVPPALARLEADARSSILAYRAALSRAGAGLEDRDQRLAALSARAEAAERSLDQYRSAVAAYARDSREAGYILDARDGSKILVYLDPSVPVAEGSTGYAMRADKELATLTFHLSGGAVSASLGKLEAEEPLRPFDAVLVDAAGAGETK